jgi:hypothetical protein
MATIITRLSELAQIRIFTPLSANDIKRFYILNGIELTSLMKLNPS